MARRTSRYNDWKKASAAFAAALGDAGQHLTGWAKELMNEAVADAMRKIDSEWPHMTVAKSKKGKSMYFGGDHDHPWYTGTLHDSVAAFVTDKNRVIGGIHYFEEAALDSQTYKGMTVLGRTEAIREANNARYYMLPGIQARFVVGAPYARDVNESTRHLGYLESLSNTFANNVEDFFVATAGHYWYNRTYIADPKKKR